MVIQMIKFLMKAYKDEELSEQEMKHLLDILETMGFYDILTEENELKDELPQ